MKRYSLVHNPDPGYRSQMCVRPDGKYVLLSDAQAALDALLREERVKALSQFDTLELLNEIKRRSKAPDTGVEPQPLIEKETDHE